MLSSLTAKLAYPYTLISLYKKSFLTPDDINRLITENCNDDVDKILNKAGLGDLLTDKHNESICQYAEDKIESLVLNQFINQSINIVRAFSGVEHNLLIYWLRQTEISNIKSILRGKAMHRSSDMIQKDLFDLGPFTTLSIEELLQAEDVPEVLRQLEKSCYASLAHYTMTQYGQNKQIFNLETSVDKQFFIGLVRRLNMLSSVDKSSLAPLLGRIIDQINLVRLLRYRVNYNLSPSHTYFLLSSGGFRLKQQELLHLVKINHMDNLLNILPENLSDHLSEKLNGKAQSIQMINSIMAQDVIEHAERILAIEAFSLASVFAYLIIRRQQLTNIHAILKGKAINMNEQAIRFAIGWS